YGGGGFFLKIFLFFFGGKNSLSALRNFGLGSEGGRATPPFGGYSKDAFRNLLSPTNKYVTEGC
ncbi:hypothetical protein AACB36_00060, partial [Enterococcus faecalis]|uniref:hypothetical protein n=1 Tax=Enterococcus faecalis TaxID=1351 RepID=UPI00316F40DE